MKLFLTKIMFFSTTVSFLISCDEIRTSREDPTAEQLKLLSDITKCEDIIKDVENKKTLVASAEYLKVDANCESVIPVLAKETWLNLSGKGLTSMELLQFAPALHLLDVGQNNINDLSSIKNHSSISSLHVFENQLSSLESLGSMPALKFLDADSNDIESLENTGPFPVLENFYLGHNKITDATPLPTISQNLKQISLFLNTLGTTVEPSEENCPTVADSYMNHVDRESYSKFRVSAECIYLMGFYESEVNEINRIQ
ncbi:MAG: leucine-rich repeat domain-containing protein [Proteobacteria bacterium]|nr:MAG: leucine-rich repeat domain-containing protein [Pseudomonadota bacterium]